MAANPENSSDQEIDVFSMFNKIGQLIDNIGFSLFKFVRFLLKNIIIIILIVIIGGVAGYFCDKYKETYVHEVVLVPNFNSIGYLYSRIDNYNIENTTIKSIRIEPVIDVYNFIYDQPNNLEIAKFFSDNDINLTKMKSNSNVEKYYRYHILTVKTTEVDKNGKTVNRILKDLNNEPYFKERMSLEHENTSRYIDILNSSIKEVDNILGNMAATSNPSAENIIQTYTDIDRLVTSKRIMGTELSKYKIHQMEETKVIYDASKVLNMKDKKIPKMILFPVLLLILFLGSAFAIRNYKKYNQRLKSEG